MALKERMSRRVSFTAVPRYLLAGILLAGLPAHATLHDEIDTILHEENLAGISWVLFHGDGSGNDSGDGSGDNSGDGATRTGVAGTRDAKTSEPFTLDTRVHVGSITKAVLATGVLRLVSEGRLGLDDAAADYLPPSLIGDVPGFSAITIRHLLDHTAGLNDAQLWQMFSLRAKPDLPLDAAFPEPREQLEPRATPGTRFSYSNTGYTLLAMVVETVTGEAYEAYLDKALLLPLGMRDSTFAYTTQEGAAADPTLAWGHVDDGSRQGATPMFLRPAGQFTSTPADLGRFARFLLSDGRIDGEPFIHPDLMHARGRARDTEAALAGLKAGYALGLGRRDRHGVVAYCHAGNIAGFFAMLCVFPDENKAFAYSVNTDSETAAYGRLDELFVRTLDVSPAREPAQAGNTSTMDLWEGVYVPSPNRFASFAYLDRLFGATRVEQQDGTLRMASLQAPPRFLRPIGNGLYAATDRSTISHVFYRNADGKRVLSSGFQTLEEVSEAAHALLMLSLLLGLTGLAWMLLAGLGILIRGPSSFVAHTLAPGFLGSALLLAPIPLFFFQSFMAMGDKTVASVSLALATTLLPLGILATLLRAVRRRGESRWNGLHGLMALAVLQWCLVLGFWGLLPFRLWA